MTWARLHDTIRRARLKSRRRAVADLVGRFLVDKGRYPNMTLAEIEEAIYGNVEAFNRELTVCAIDGTFVQ
jgi:hypothetical protein